MVKTLSTMLELGTQAPDFSLSDVVSGRAIDRLKATNVLQHPFPERHVAAGNMLRDFLAQHNLRRVAGGKAHGLRDRAVIGWHKVWTTDGDHVAVH